MSIKSFQKEQLELILYQMLCDEVANLDRNNQIDFEIQEIARENNLQEDDDRDEILEIYTDRLFEEKYHV
tara:strand:- start:282 stop:491 length:210 start_codon:yes stop_codon:yes gene_type:complete